MTLRTRLACASIALGAAALVAGAVVHSAGQSGGAPATGPVVDRGTVPGTTPQTSAPAARGSLPDGSRLAVPALGVSAPVGRVAAVHGVMQIPRDPKRLAWWRDGAAPGDPQGTAVLVGHVNYHGVSGALASLADLDPGDRLTLTEPGRGALRYRVAAVRTYAKARGIPSSTFARDGAARLVLITCGGPFDPATGNYLDNIVAYAVPD